MKLRIIAAALRDNMGCIWTLPRPARHHHILWAMKSVNDTRWKEDRVSAAHQGFMTSDGRYVDRKQARRIAEAAGQLVESHSLSKDLFSEDVW